MKTVMGCLTMLALAAGTAWAQQDSAAPADLRPAAYTAPHYDPRGTTQNVCMAPAVGGCQACQASCPTGQSAMCSPGTAQVPQTGSACLTPPSCSCR